MTEPRAWLYEPPVKLVEELNVQPLILSNHADAMAVWARSMGWTEIPLYGPEALAERDGRIAELEEALEAVADGAMQNGGLSVIRTGLVGRCRNLVKGRIND